MLGESWENENRRCFHDDFSQFEVTSETYNLWVESEFRKMFCQNDKKVLGNITETPATWQCCHHFLSQLPAFYGLSRSLLLSHTELHLEPSSRLPAALSFWLDKSTACFPLALLWHARCDHVLFLLAFAGKWYIWAGLSAQPISKKKLFGSSVSLMSGNELDPNPYTWAWASSQVAQFMWMGQAQTHI